MQRATVSQPGTVQSSHEYMIKRFKVLRAKILNTVGSLDPSFILERFGLDCVNVLNTVRERVGTV